MMVFSTNTCPENNKHHYFAALGFCKCWPQKKKDNASITCLATMSMIGIVIGIFQPKLSCTTNSVY